MTAGPPARRWWPSVALGAGLGLAVAVPSIGWWQAHDAAARVPHAAPVDIGFLQDMAQHHAQAVTMANLVAGRVSPQVATLVGQIAEAQLVEFGEMRGMLRAWGHPPVSDAAPMAWMAVDPAMPMPGHGGGQAGMAQAGMVMPGMASVADLERLRTATGQPLDTLFLQLMLRHHLGAIPMARAATRRAETLAVRSLAAGMVREQSEEAAAIRTMLAARGAEPLPFQHVPIAIGGGT